MKLSEQEARNLLEKILGYSTADSAIVRLNGSDTYNLRYARNSISTNGYADELTVSVTSNIGRKSGSTSTNKFDEDSLKAAVKKSEEIAKFSPENKEFMPPLGPQQYIPAANYSAETENLSAAARSEIVSNVINSSVKNNVICAGYMEDLTNFEAVLNSNGLFAYNKGTNSKLSSTIRTSDGTGSGRFEKSYVNIGDIKSAQLTDWVINRAKLSVGPAELKPGRYTVILEHSAASDMLSLCVNFMGARGADEGRSFFSKAGGGTLIGEQLADSRVNIYSDPSDTKAPSSPFSWDGEPKSRIVWFENGVLKNLHRGRYWAEKTGQPLTPRPSNVIMKGGTKTVDELIASSEYAVLVTRFWYIRTVDPKTMLLTGLTRDGVFEVKDGKITRPVKNFRFNESPMNILKNISELGAAEKAVGSETDDFPIHVPAMKVDNFNFSSLSDAI